jgi:hypothetical protein
MQRMRGAILRNGLGLHAKRNTSSPDARTLPQGGRAHRMDDLGQTHADLLDQDRFIRSLRRCTCD